MSLLAGAQLALRALLGGAAGASVIEGTAHCDIAWVAVRRIPEWILLRRHVPVQVDLLREFRFRYGLQQRRRRRPLCWDGLLLVHGERDITCPLRESALFAVALASSGQNVEFVTLRDDANLTFLVDLMAGRACRTQCVELLGHLRRFCAGGAPVARL